MDPELIITDDGSHSLFHAGLGETYHSRHGALAESLHVFIENGLRHSQPSGDITHVLEVGFGTGLNALLTWQHAGASGRTIHYTGIEPFPLKEETWRRLNYGTLLHAADAFATLHKLAWNEAHELDPFFTFFKLRAGVEDFTSPDPAYDVVYYDAFAPGKQPAMWAHETLSVVVKALRPGGLLVTYCAKGEFRRTLRALGMEVEPLPGPPGKREMTRARRAGFLSPEKGMTKS